MNKSELIEAIAKSADISKAAAEKALDGTLNAIKATLKKGSNVTLVGFGTFKVGKRAARTVKITACVRTGSIVPKGGNTVDCFFVRSAEAVLSPTLDVSRGFETLDSAASGFGGASSTNML